MNLKHFNLKGISLLVLVLVFSRPALSQDYLKTPEALNSYVKNSYIEKIYNNQLSLEEISKKTASRFWTVYSDRKKNKLYNDAGGFSNEDHLDFMEMVVVKDVKTTSGKTWLHVYSKHYKEEEKLAENHKERGWIRADKVILSNYSLLNEKSIPQKRMTLYSLDLQDKNVEKEFYPYYKSPSAKQKNYLGEARRFRIYYVLKEEASWVLLSKTDKLNGSNQKSNVLGWIQKKYTTSWDHRICYEPSSGRRAKNSYKDKILPVFQNISSLNSFIETEMTNNKKYFKQWKIKEKRLDPYIMRMPILENKDENRKKVVAIANINDITDKDKSKVVEKLARLKDKQEKVNVFFVIDGTQSMAPYFPKIRESITRIIHNNENRMSKTTLRFGLSIYRDYADGNKTFEIVPLTSNHNKVINKLRLVKTQSKDTDLPEAQYQGLVKGIEQAGFDPQNSNVVVLVGDAGNHANDPKGFSTNDVIKELYKYKASLITFQVINGNDPSYDKFYYDAFKFLTQTAQKHVTNKSEVKINQTSIKNTYRLEYPSYKKDNKDLFMFGRYTYASGQRPMEPAILERSIIESTDAYLKKVDNVVGKLERLREGTGGGKAQPRDKVAENFLKSSGNFSESDLQALRSLGEFTMKGYVSKKYYNQDINCFNPVVFLSYDEKRQIDKVLKSLIYGNRSITERKKELQSALLEQCKRMLGDVSDANILDKTMDDVWQIILAIPFTGDSYIKSKKLREIKSISDERFHAFYSEFEEAARKFAQNDYRDSRFELADQKYYWIPLDDIPGNQ